MASSGLDPIPTNLVKAAAVQLNPILMHIVNTSLSLGILFFQMISKRRS
jgi:hypothetical protein